MIPDFWFIFWTVVTIIIVIICIIVFVYGVREMDGEPMVGGVVVGIIVIIVYVVANYPIDMKYHSYVPVSGTVSEVGDRILTQDGDLTQKFVVKFDDNPQEYGCLDTRCSLVEKGDFLSLSCKQVYVYAGTDGFDCEFVERKPAAAK